MLLVDTDNRSFHSVEIDQPEVVTAAIRHMVAAVHTRSGHYLRLSAPPIGHPGRGGP
jgi:hypothetical protein